MKLAQIGPVFEGVRRVPFCRLAPENDVLLRLWAVPISLQHNGFRVPCRACHSRQTGHRKALRANAFRLHQSRCVATVYGATAMTSNQSANTNTVPTATAMMKSRSKTVVSNHDTVRGQKALCCYHFRVTFGIGCGSCLWHTSGTGVSRTKGGAAPYLSGLPRDSKSLALSTSVASVRLSATMRAY